MKMRACVLCLALVLLVPKAEAAEFRGRDVVMISASALAITFVALMVSQASKKEDKKKLAAISPTKRDVCLEDFPAICHQVMPRESP